MQNIGSTKTKSSVRRFIEKLTYLLAVCTFFLVLPGQAGTGTGWNIVDTGILVLLLSLVIGGGYFLAREKPHWKALLIVLVLTVCGLQLYKPGPGGYTPGNQLKPAQDLRGGIRLIYQVTHPVGVGDKKKALEDTIAVLKRRVDPDGLLNIIFTPLGTDRIEIEMALAPPKTKILRDAYFDARDKIEEGNIDPQELDTAMFAKGDLQKKLLEKLGGKSKRRIEFLGTLVEAYDSLEKARTPKDALEKERDDLDKTIRNLGAAAKPEAKAALTKQLIAKQKALDAAVSIFFNVNKTYDLARQKVLSTNIGPGELEYALDLSNVIKKKKKKEDEAKQSPRTLAVNKLKTKHPDRIPLIDAADAAHIEYQQVRGVLDDYHDLINILQGSGVLEFRIAPTAREFDQTEQYRTELREKGHRVKGKEYRWMAIDDAENFITPDRKSGETKKALLESLEKNPEAFFANRGGYIVQKVDEVYYMLLSDQPGRSMTQRDRNWKLDAAYHAQDSEARPAVGFKLNPVGADLMGEMTRNNMGQPMAIILDKKVMSAPSIRGAISSSGIITGQFSREDITNLTRTLGAGSLQAQLDEFPITISETNAKLGEENVSSGISAAVWALILVAIFMAIYYLFAGMVANFALAANMVIILGVMAMQEAVFTLPGIAGIVLTIGMAVDANVLIFERIREELDRGVDLKLAVRLGYEKALATIIDANLTTLITCLVLGYTATPEVKGFALTLGIGIMATMFTALFCTRVIIDYYIALVKPKTLSMLPIIFPGLGKMLHPNIDWVGKRKMLFGISAVLIVGGILAIAIRGADILDIEFRGGTQVTLELKKDKYLSESEFKEQLDLAADAAKLPQLRGSGTSAASVQTMGKLNDEGKAREFKISTLVENPQAVADAITKHKGFSDVLDIKRRIEFAGNGEIDQSAPPMNESPVYIVSSDELWTSIKHRKLVGSAIQLKVNRYLGNVAIHLDKMNPPAKISDIKERIRRVQAKPPYNQLDARQFEVVGLTPSEKGPGFYDSVLIVARDESTNYLSDPSSFEDEDGLAVTQWRLTRDALTRDSSLGSVQNISGTFSATMQQQAIGALFLSLLAVVLYIWFRFGSLRYGMAAIAALLHDVLIGVGLVAASIFIGMDPIRIDLVLVGAVLTIVGYSLNDTIVVFDRIRENRGRLAQATPQIINDSINQTISRTVLTSGTTFLAVSTLFLAGGDGVRGFSFMMLIGVVVGTYSSIGIASSLLLVGIRDGKKKDKDEKIGEKKGGKKKNNKGDSKAATA